MKHIQLEVCQKYVHYMISDRTAIVISEDDCRENEDDIVEAWGATCSKGGWKYQSDEISMNKYIIISLL